MRTFPLWRPDFRPPIIDATAIRWLVAAALLTAGDPDLIDAAVQLLGRVLQ